MRQELSNWSVYTCQSSDLSCSPVLHISCHTSGHLTLWLCPARLGREIDISKMGLSVPISKRDHLSWAVSPDGGHSDDEAGGAGVVASVWQGFWTLVPLWTIRVTCRL